MLQLYHRVPHWTPWSPLLSGYLQGSEDRLQCVSGGTESKSLQMFHKKITYVCELHCRRENIQEYTTELDERPIELRGIETCLGFFLFNEIHQNHIIVTYPWCRDSFPFQLQHLYHWLLHHINYTVCLSQRKLHRKLLSHIAGDIVTGNDDLLQVVVTEKTRRRSGGFCALLAFSQCRQLLP